MPLNNLFYTMVQKSQKWPKTQIKGRGPALKLETHRLRTQSPKKVNLDNIKSNNNQSKNKQRLRLDRLRNWTWAQATTRNIMLEKSGKTLKEAF